jgi:protein SCO1/2
MQRWVIAFMLFVAAAGSAAATAALRTGALEPPRPAPDFALDGADGAEFRLSRQRGAVVVLAFGYTFCPDVCPTTLAELAQVKGRLGDDARRLRVAFITVDPERDTRDRLRTYVRAFDPTFVGLSGPPERLRDVLKAYGVTATRRTPPGTAAAYLVDHTAMVFVIDPEGRLRLAVPFGTSVDDLAHDIKHLLRR